MEASISQSPSTCTTESSKCSTTESSHPLKNAMQRLSFRQKISLLDILAHGKVNIRNKHDGR